MPSARVSSPGLFFSQVNDPDFSGLERFGHDGPAVFNGCRYGHFRFELPGRDLAGNHLEGELCRGGPLSPVEAEQDFIALALEDAAFDDRPVPVRGTLAELCWD